MEFKGIIPYLVSPYDTNKGRLKLDSLENLSNSLIERGVHGLSPLGSNGEVHYLSREEKIEIVKTVINSADKRVPVIPGVTAYTTKDAIEQINELEKLGINGVVIILQTYFPLTRSQIVTMLQTVARNVTCPIVLYNNPKFANVDLTPDIVIELAEESNIQYFKDATGQTGRILTITNNLDDKLKIFSASAHIPLHVMQLGGVGWMAGPACIFPEDSIKLFELAEERKWEEAFELQKKLWKVNEAFQKYNLVPCVKSILNMQGFDVGSPIPPLEGLTQAAEDDLRLRLNHLI